MLTKKKDFLDLASETIKNLNEQPIEEDECTIVGKRFALQLRGMTDHQKYLAEKIIGDVMYHGRMNMLTEDSYQFKSGNKPNLDDRQTHVHKQSLHLTSQSNRPMPLVQYQQLQQQLYQQQHRQQQQQQTSTVIEDDIYEPIILTVNDV